MSDSGCTITREHLPEHLAGALDDPTREAVTQHLGACADCREEVELLRALRASRPRPPADLAARVRTAVAADRAAPARRGGPTARSLVTAAAALVLALGTGLFWHARPGAAPTGGLARLALEPVPEEWTDEDALVAGAPVYEALTSEALVALLEEMDE